MGRAVHVVVVSEFDLDVWAIMQAPIQLDCRTSCESKTRRKKVENGPCYSAHPSYPACFVAGFPGCCR